MTHARTNGITRGLEGEVNAEQQVAGLAGGHNRKLQSFFPFFVGSFYFISLDFIPSTSRLLCASCMLWLPTITYIVFLVYTFISTGRCTLFIIIGLCNLQHVFSASRGSLHRIDWQEQVNKNKVVSKRWEEREISSDLRVSKQILKLLDIQRRFEDRGSSNPGELLRFLEETYISRKSLQSVEK